MSLLTAENPLTLGELHVRRHAANVAYDVNAAGRIEALERRVAAGERKIAEEEAIHQEWPVETAGDHWQAIDRARLKLVALQDELQQLRLGYEIPVMLFDSLYSLIEWTTKKGLPEGSLLTVAIPNSLHFAVDLSNANEAPF